MDSSDENNKLLSALIEQGCLKIIKFRLEQVTTEFEQVTSAPDVVSRIDTVLRDLRWFGRQRTLSIKFLRFCSGSLVNLNQITITAFVVVAIFESGLGRIVLQHMPTSEGGSKLVLNLLHDWIIQGMDTK